MRNTRISFDRLPDGSLFDSRLNTWIKLPKTICEGGKKYNAVHEEYLTLEDAELVSTQLFPDEILVLYDPTENCVSWE